MRMQNWDARVVGWAESVLGQPFVWGKTDCAMNVRALSRALYGRDVFKVETWKSKVKALRLLTEKGGLQVALAQVAHPIGRGFATTGDVALMPDKGLAASLLVVVEQKAVAATPGKPLQFVALSSLPPDTQFWRLDVH